MAATYPYRPDYAVPPGSVLKEYLEARGFSNAEFARRCGRSAKLISEILSGKAPVEPETALQFERVLGMDARIWLGIEADYQLHQRRTAEAEDGEAAAWAEHFPVRELAKRGVMEGAARTSKHAPQLLAFFGVASVEAWHTKYSVANVAYRHSPTFESDKHALATWLRLAELSATEQPCADFREPAFKQALAHVRTLTSESAPESLHNARRLCNDAGVALSLVKPLPKTHLSGAAWWHSPRRPIIALSAHHRTDDHLWFSFFHEAAHILLHSRKSIFVDGTSSTEDEVELEADEWAANFLVPRKEWQRLVIDGEFTDVKIRQFAKEQGIAPGILVGRLQNQKLLPWNRLNNIKVALKWTDEWPDKQVSRVQLT